MEPEDVQLLEQLPFSIHLPDYRALIVHAGVVPMDQFPGSRGPSNLQCSAPAPVGDNVAAGSSTCAAQHGVEVLLAHQKLHDLLCMRNVVQSAAAGGPAAGSADPARHHTASHAQQTEEQHTNGQTVTGGSTQQGNQVVHYVASEDPSQGGPWAAAWPGPEHVFFGHDARRCVLQRCS